MPDSERCSHVKPRHPDVEEDHGVFPTDVHKDTFYVRLLAEPFQREQGPWVEIHEETDLLMPPFPKRASFRSPGRDLHL